MNRKPNFINILLSVLVGMTLLVSAAQPNLVSASTAYAGGEGIRTSVHPQTGKLSFLGADPSSPIRVDAAMRTDLSAEGRGMAILDVYGRQFGLKNPQEELRLTSTREMDGRGTKKYQQLYQGIPVMAGELIVNTNAQGGLLSINGEVSPDLDISITPAIDAAQAQGVALGEIASAYGLNPSDVTASEPELWIYDARLMNGENVAPAHLVWRMEITSESAPLRELVLVNAQSGKISLHFNQIDTAWTGNVSSAYAKEEVIEESVFFAAEPVSAPVTGVNIPFSVNSSLNRFVATTGVNSGDCSDDQNPCETINYAIGQSADGDTIGVAEGTYTGSGNQVVSINKSVNLSGGWNGLFEEQTGYSLIDGENERTGIYISRSSTRVVAIDRFMIEHGTNGIYNGSDLTLTRSVIRYSENAGVYDYAGALQIVNSSIHSNAGAGVALEGNTPLSEAIVTINNSTISKNSSSGIAVDIGADVTILNSTISANKISGVYITSTASLVSFQNSIIAQNVRYGSVQDCGGGLPGAYVSLGNNIIGSTNWCGISPTSGDQFDIDSKLGVFLPSHGIHPLVAGSPAINKANQTKCMATDQRGISRQPICDIGAFEYKVPGAAVAMYQVEGGDQTLGPGKDIDNIKVIIVDIHGNPVPGISVIFTAPPSGPSGVFVTIGTNTATVYTDSSGVATIPTFTVNNQLGSFFIDVVSSVGSFQYNVTTELWYVKATGGDNNNDCKTPATPCATLHGAFYRGDFYAGSVVWVTAEAVPYDFGDMPFGVGQSYDLIGGWDATFTTQSGYTKILGTIEIFEGMSGTNPVYHIDRVDIMPNGLMTAFKAGIRVSDNCTLNLTNSILHGGWYGITNSNGVINIENSAISENTHGGVHAEFGEIRISNSTISDNTGSGIYQHGNVATVENSTITNNSATKGGGILNDLGSTLYLNNSVVTGNTASEAGGGIYNSGVLMEINHSTIQDNQAFKSGVITFGGGIYTSGHPQINDSNVTQNSATRGGGIYSGNVSDYLEPRFAISRTVIDKNTAEDGAGLWLSGPVLIDDSSIIKNTATGKGGGLFMTTPELALSNVTISGNIAGLGGAVYNAEGSWVFEKTSTFLNVTISRNRGGTSGGIVSESAAWPIALVNSLIAGNLGSTVDCNGQFISKGHNLIGNIGNASTPKCGGDWSATDVLGTDSAKILVSSVLVTTLKKNAATGQWYHSLKLGSPAIDAGNTAVSGKLSCPSTDQLGTTRPQSVYCDIGAVEFKFSVSPPNPLLQTYDANNKTALPGTLSCSGNDATCGNADAHILKAHQNAFSTFSKYLEWHARNSIDGNGVQVISSVHYGSNYQNAYWNGHMMVYGDAYGFPLADDIVAHELTHGVTQYTSDLFMWYQSGAINESFSDLWGEAIDQANGLGNDAAGVMWLIGEDVSGLGAIRSMKLPLSYGQPDSMLSSKYCDHGVCLEDNGGAHINSGVNNKAVFLMVNGGTFNGKQVSGLGWTKVLTIYYEAQTNLLSSGSDYLDLYNYLYQACLNKVGTNGIVKADCAEVRDATAAVKMNQQPTANFNPDIAYCPAGTLPAIPDLFYEDFETGTNGWTLSRFSGEFAWSLVGENAISGKGSLWADDSFGETDAYASLMAFTVPRGVKPYLHFTHMYKYQTSGSTYFDGGVLEYSIGTGSWKDAKPLFSGGQNYKGAIKTGSGNPLQGREGFVGDSHGYVQSRYDLSSLAGKYVSFRWRMGTDNAISELGWYLDEVHIYKCVSIPAVPILSLPANGDTIADTTPIFNWSDSKPDLHHYELQIATTSAFNVGVVKYNNIAVSIFTPTLPLAADQYYWRVRAFNAAGKASAWSTVWKFTIQ